MRYEGVALTERISKTIEYYDEALKVTIKNFGKHGFEKWADFRKASGGNLPFALEIKTKQFMWRTKAIEIENKKLQDSASQLPASIIVKLN